MVGCGGNGGMRFAVFFTLMFTGLSAFGADLLPVEWRPDCQAELTSHQKIVVGLPSFVRRWHRQLVPGASQIHIDALHAKLRTLIPPDFASQLFTSTHNIGPSDIFRWRGSSSDQLFKNFHAARSVLHEILEVTEDVYGQNSEAAGLANLSLSLFYGSSSSKQDSVERGRDTYSGIYNEVNEFALEAVRQARLARDRLRPFDVSTWMLSRLQLIKQLVNCATLMGQTNVYTMDWYPKPVQEGYQETFAEAVGEVGEILTDYMEQPLPRNIKVWLYLNLMYQRHRLASLKASVDYRALGHRYRLFETDGLESAQARERDLRDILNVALAQREVLPLLLRERSDGVLFGILNGIRWATYDRHLKTPSGDGLNEGLFEMESRFHSGEIQVEELLVRLKSLGFEIPEPAAAAFLSDR